MKKTDPMELKEAIEIAKTLTNSKYSDLSQNEMAALSVLITHVERTPINAETRDLAIEHAISQGTFMDDQWTREALELLWDKAQSAIREAAGGETNVRPILSDAMVETMAREYKLIRTEIWKSANIFPVDENDKEAMRRFAAKFPEMSPAMRLPSDGMDTTREPEIMELVGQLAEGNILFETAIRRAFMLGERSLSLPVLSSPEELAKRLDDFYVDILQEEEPENVYRRFDSYPKPVQQIKTEAFSRLLTWMREGK